LQDPRVLAFLLVLFGVNLLFGLGSISMAGVEQAIAWQAHIGGFLAVSWHSPHSIPFRSRRAAARMDACAANAVLVVIPARGGYHLVQTV